jgi:hypothetical protein
MELAPAATVATTWRIVGKEQADLGLRGRWRSRSNTPAAPAAEQDGQARPGLPPPS